MSFLSAVTGFFTGEKGLVGTITDTVKAYFPPSMSDKEKAELAARISEAEHKQEKALMALAVDADKEVTRRAAELEGTAKDLASLPVVGRFIIFARGCLRPLFGYFTLFVDWQIFSNSWDVSMTTLTGEFTAEGILIIVLNILVLGFLFGERTVKNLMPLFTKFMETRGK
ncbi:hypothetical protein [Pseudodesulfovibrio sediminis]|uniref:Uncharacterized protein n=1 Tax=Pseudodesulfovibrio sediminis TaxID=2810563 RepID=A0ABM7P994_9BACT|nr:hypothetical protein [Pseudodesulfovibrio sediminis]BCS89967.1 hypothetical protein PSDVSF_32090 [Pseudodesulfovibrio sediminis]